MEPSKDEGALTLGKRKSRLEKTIDEMYWMKIKIDSGINSSTPEFSTCAADLQAANAKKMLSVEKPVRNQESRVGKSAGQDAGK